MKAHPSPFHALTPTQKAAIRSPGWLTIHDEPWYVQFDADCDAYEERHKRDFAAWILSCYQNGTALMNKGHDLPIDIARVLADLEVLERHKEELADPARLREIVEAIVRQAPDLLRKKDALGSKNGVVVD